MRALPDGTIVQRGAHRRFEDGACAMELVAWIAGERHSDEPTCASPVIGAYARSLNDAMPDDQRQRLIPYIARIAGSRDDTSETHRARIAADYAIRQMAPLALDAAGLPGVASHLRRIDPITDIQASRDARDAAWAARAAAGAAGDAGAAAKDAARDAAWAAAGAALAAGNAWAAAGAAGAAGAAWASRDAARAAGDAAWDIALGCLDAMLDHRSDADAS